MLAGLLQKKVSISGHRPLLECQEALQAMTRPAFSLRQRNRAFVGWVQDGEGKIWFSRKRGFSQSARSLRFRLVPDVVGCRLEGELVPVLPLQIFLLAYIVFCLGMTGWLIIESITHRTFTGRTALRIVASPVVSILFGWGYATVATWFGSSGERLGLKLIEHVMPSEQSAAVALDLLQS